MSAFGLTCLLFLLPTSQDPGRADLPDRGPPLRERLIGRAVTPDGKAWAGAKVVLFHRPIPDFIRLGEPDRVEVQAADNGRFRAELLHGRAYVAWAEQVGEDGKTRVSDVVAGVFAGETLKLLQREAPAAPMTCRLEGLDAWQQAKLPEGSYRALLGPQSMVLDLGKTDGVTEFLLPPHPFDRVVLERLDATGKVLAAKRLSRMERRHLPLIWNLPAPRRLRLEVRGPDGPIAGAEVWSNVHLESIVPSDDDAWLWRMTLGRTWRATWEPFGRSDADGVIVCSVPASGNTIALIVRADGFAEQSFELDPSVSHPVRLEPVGELRGKLLFPDGSPVAGLPFVVRRKFMTKMYKSAGQRIHEDPGELHRTGADGSFSLGFLPAESHYRLLTVLTPELWEVLAPTYGKVPLPSAELVLGQGTVDKAGKDLGALRLDRLVCVRATIHAARAEREARARLLLRGAEEQPSSGHRDPPPMMRTFDPGGEVAFLVPASGYQTLVVHPLRGVSTEPLTLEPKDPPGRVFEWAVRLEPFLSIEAVVTDGKGNPAAGARLESRSGGYSNVNGLCTEIFRWNRQAITRTIADDGGHAVLRLIPVKGQSYGVRAGAADSRGGTRPSFRISTDAPPKKLELEVGN